MIFRQLHTNSPSHYFTEIADSMYRLWPTECLNDDGCNGSEELSLKLRQEHINPTDLPITFCAISNNKIIGSVSICECDMRGSSLKPWLSSLWVLETHRGAKISSDLIEYALLFAKDILKINHIHLYVKESHPFAKHFYKNKFGFVEEMSMIHCNEVVCIMTKMFT